MFQLIMWIYTIFPAAAMSFNLTICSAQETPVELHLQDPRSQRWKSGEKL